MQAIRFKLRFEGDLHYASNQLKSVEDLMSPLVFQGLKKLQCNSNGIQMRR